jgi:hypothetical protein
MTVSQEAPTEAGNLNFTFPVLIRLLGSLILETYGGNVFCPLLDFFEAAHRKGEQMDRCERW